MTPVGGGLGLPARLAEAVVRRPRAVLVAAAMLAVLCAPLVALRLRLDTDVVNLIPVGVPEAAAFARFSRVFGSEQLLVVLVEAEDPARLADFAERYAEALRKEPGIAEVRLKLGSAAAQLLTTHLLDLLADPELDALSARVRPAALAAQARHLRALLAAPGGSSMAPLLTVDPLELLPLLRDRLQAGMPIDPTSGYYRSPDGKALLLFVRPSSSPFAIEADRALISSASAVAERLGAEVPAGPIAPRATPQVGYTGAYAYALAYRDWLHRDTQLSTLISGVSVLLFFAALLGALRVLPFVGVPLFVGLWFTAAAAAAIYGRVNAVSLAFGTILLAIGIDLPIQIYNRLREELGRRAPLDALQHTVERLAGPAVLATLAPAAVFYSCALSRYRGLGELGVLAGTGLVLNLVVMLTVLPALLALVPARLWAPRGPAPGQAPGFAALGRLAGRRPGLFLIVAGGLSLAAIPQLRHVRFERRLISIEPPAMPPARIKREIEQRFGGREHLLLVLSEDGDPEAALGKGDRWLVRAEALRRRGLLSSYESLSALFPSRAEIERRRARIAALAPDKVAADLRAALDEAGLDAEAFHPFLDALVHPPAPLSAEAAAQDAGAGELAFLVHAHLQDRAEPTGARRYVTTYLYPPEARTAEAIAALRAYAREAPDDGQLTGEPILEEAFREVVEADTLRVTLASVLAVVLLIVAYYRRWRPILAVLLPLLCAWILFAAALGAADLPLNLFNLLAVPLVVGYGIDDHVFLVHRHEEDPAAGPERALGSTGRAIVVTSLSTMAGFAGLAVARFDGLRSLGTTGALAVALCLVAAFAVLPALLAVLYRRR